MRCEGRCEHTLSIGHGCYHSAIAFARLLQVLVRCYPRIDPALVLRLQLRANTGLTMAQSPLGDCRDMGFFSSAQL